MSEMLDHQGNTLNWGLQKTIYFFYLLQQVQKKKKKELEEEISRLQLLLGGVKERCDIFNNKLIINK